MISENPTSFPVPPPGILEQEIPQILSELRSNAKTADLQIRLQNGETIEMNKMIWILCDGALKDAFQSLPEE